MTVQFPSSRSVLEQIAKVVQLRNISWLLEENVEEVVAENSVLSTAAVVAGGDGDLVVAESVLSTAVEGAPVIMLSKMQQLN